MKISIIVWNGTLENRGEYMGKESKVRQQRREGTLPKVNKKKKTPRWIKILVPIIVVAIILTTVFSIWGYSERNVLAKVGKESVTADEVNSQLDYYKNIYSQYGITMTQDQEEQYKQSILNSLIEESLLVQYAKDNNLKIDQEQYKKNLDDQISSYISQQEQSNGEQTFLDWVNGQYGSLDAYKEYLAKQIGPYVERPLLAQAALDEQYKSITVTDDDVKAYFTSVKEVSAEHLLVQTKDVTSKSEKESLKKMAEDILAEIKQKQTEDKNFNFATYAQAKVKEINEKNDGKEVLKYENLGYFGKGTMVKAFEDACFASDVKVGDIIGVVETDFGYHIIHILGQKTVQETYNEPEKVNVRLVQFNFDANDSKSKENAFTSAKSISVQTRNGMSFVDAVKRFSEDTTTKDKDGETGFFSRDEKPEIYDAAIKLKKGGISDPIEISSPTTAYVVVQLIDIQPPKTATLSDKTTYDKVKEELTSNKQAEIKEKFVEELKQKYGVRTTNPGRVIANFFRKYVAKPFNNFYTWVNNMAHPQTNTSTPSTPSTEETQPLEPVNPSAGS